MKKNIVIIHYNTPSLTECLVRSINLFVKDAEIYIFDNSDVKPFTAKFDNVTIIDNTKGKYIDFKEWLKKYPDRNKSHGRVNEWGSAKHCYSVEKCMEILKENFVLLDSDILLKRDISNLYRDDLMYIGDVVTQPNSSIKRVLPFICYINVKMCLEKGVHYFDENYMHGLSYTKSNKYADSYDTGAAFYLQASKYKHEEIKYENYSVHYGHGSWNKAGDRKKVNPNEWLKRNKKYWSDDKNTKVVYTCITGDYDGIIEPKFITDGFDYICFTDNMDLKSDVWEIRPLPKETESLSQVKKQRYVKINAHKVLSEYDLSIWVDGNVELKDDLNEFIKETLVDDCSIYVPKHPVRKCIYAEAKVVISMKKDTKENVNKQIERYSSEGFPKDYGLLQSNIVLRRHNNEDCIRLMEAWFNELKNGSHRDQLSFNYVAWKNQDINFMYMDKGICYSKWFNWRAGHAKMTQKKSTPVATNTPTNKNTLKRQRQAFNAMMSNRLNARRLSTHNILIYN